MTIASSTFSRTLGGVTKIKLDAVTTRQTAFLELKAKLLERIKNVSSTRERIQILIDGYEKVGTLGFANAYETINFNDNLMNSKRLFEQAKLDPSVGNSVLASWEETLLKGLEVEDTKLKYASLFGDLLKEWLGSDGDGLKETEDTQRTMIDEQVKDFEDHAFSELQTDQDAIEEYLSNLFSTPALQIELETLRSKLEQSSRNLSSQPLTRYKLRMVANSIFKTPLLDNDKMAILKEFLQDDVVLGEVVDVINRSISSLESWNWDGPVPIDVRRQLNGKYRVYMDEDIIQSLLFHYIGCEWEHATKEHLQALFMGPNWIIPEPTNIKAKYESYNLTAMPVKRARMADRARFGSSPRGNIAQIRHNDQYDYFLGLLNSEYESANGVVDGYDTDQKHDPNRREINNTLLGMLATEIRLNLSMHKRFTVVHSDFKWFGPALPHSTILAVFKFMGVPQLWLTFFEKFLRAPLLFPDSNGGGDRVRIRTRGSALAHKLSGVFGEAMMFFMDFAVNQRTKGVAHLYRIHDDLWFWNKDVEPCEIAWGEIQQFAEVMGLEFNFHKTGSVTIGGPPSENLPKGNVQWCLLTLNLEGKFEINTPAVKNHIQEIKRQLSACNSILSWTRAWNRYYASFLPRNLGSPMNALGPEHVEIVTAALVDVQKQIFPDHSGVTEFLRSRISEKFGIEDIPDGWFYWPTRLGGLALENPITNLLAVRNRIARDYNKKFAEHMRVTVSDHESHAREWERKYGTKFMTFEEYLAGWEHYDTNWGSLFLDLQKEGIPESPEETPEITSALATIADSERNTIEPQKEFDDMSVYWQWVVALYAAEMMEKFNGLEAVTPGILPVGMIEAFRGMRIKWEK